MIEASRRTFTPVQIMNHVGDGCLVIDSIKRTIECLTEFWPVRYGEAFEDALQACIDGINNRISPEEVRKALIKAANEAGICYYLNA